MRTQNVTLKIPGELYDQIRERAGADRRSVEDETLDLLTTAVPVGDALPGDLSAAADELSLLDDEGLWHAARSRLAADAATELESLHVKQQRQGLTPAESQTLDALVRQYERAMLVRARAAALLHERGHDVAELVAQP